MCLCGPPSNTAANVETEVAAPTVHGVSLRTAEDQTVTQAEVAATSDTADTITYGGRVFINLSGPRDSWPEPPSDEEAPAAPAQKSVSEELLPDTMTHRQKIANQHGLLWGTVSGDSRYSIVDAIRHQRPPLKLICVKTYLAALKDGKMPAGKQVLPLIEQYVFLMLSIDLQPYQRRGAGVYKASLTKAKLKNLVEAFFVSKGSSATSKEKRSATMKPYAELWEFVKLETLKQCGLAVSSSPAHRVCFQGQPVNPQSPLREGTWRQQVFCLGPHSLEHEEWEDTAEREAKRIRYVQAAMHEQSMGRPSKKEYEVSLPIDTDALTCADFDTRSEWDAMHPYVQYVSTNWLAPEIGDKLLPETHAYVLKPSQGGMAHGEAEGLTVNVGMSLRTTERAAQNIGPNSSMSLRATGVTGDNVDPSSSMSLRATGVTGNNIDPSSSMSLRATGVTENNTDPNSSLPLRAAGVEPDNTDINSSMSLQAAGPAAVSSSSMSLRTAGLTTEGPALDPTQASFVQHMSSWMNAYKSEAASFKANLPMSQDPEDRQNLTESVLLLGTAGTGKTTTLQAANRLLETHGLAGRIVRCAYTGVAASNMGMGGRTLVSLFRLSRRGFGGGLEALSQRMF